MPFPTSWPVRLGLAAAVVIALAAAGAAGWWFLVREDAQLATSAPLIPDDLRSPTAVGSAATPAATGPLEPGVRRFVIVSERSEAAYFAGEKLAALSLPSTAKGTTNEIEGEFYLTSSGLDPARESKFTVDLRTLRSDEARRDRQVQDRGLQTARFPFATFVAAELIGLPSEFPAGEEVEMQLTGVFDLRGVQRDVTWEVKARIEGNVLSALATVNFRYADFGIPRLNIAGFVTVEEDVTLQVQVIATEQ